MSKELNVKGKELMTNLDFSKINGIAKVQSGMFQGTTEKVFKRVGILTTVLAFLAAACLSNAQIQPAPNPPAAPAPHTKALAAEKAAIRKAEIEGIEVRIKDIARFRGIRANQLVGYGLVMGLSGTGDTKKSIFTPNALANMLKNMGLSVDPRQLDVKNVAAVMITADLPPFANNGQKIDVTVTSIGDAKSLQGGTLIQSELFAAGDKQTVYAVAQGAVSIGGFQVSGGGNSVQKNHVTVGRIPEGAIVEQGAPTKLIYNGNKMYLELDEQDLTTAKRVAGVLMDKFPDMLPLALDGATIELTLPVGMTPVQAMSKIEMQNVFADTPAVVVINERTGTIVMGGNVRLGPAAIAHGSLNVRIDSETSVSQPNPFGQGNTQVVTNTAVAANDTTTQIAVIAPSTTVQDLARIFQALQLKPTDIIAILQALKQQGALKARIEIQ